METSPDNIYVEIFSAEHVPQGGGGQEPGGVRGIGHVHHGGHRVEHLEVDNSVHGDGDAVLGQNLLGRDIEGDEPEVHGDDIIDAGEDGEQPRAHSTALLDPSEPEDHSSLVLLKIQSKTWLYPRFDLVLTHLNLFENDKQREGEGDAAEDHREDPEESLNTTARSFLSVNLALDPHSGVIFLA